MIEQLQDLEKNRDILGVSQEKMARKLDVSLKTYHNWLTEKTEPSFENKYKMNELLSILRDKNFIHCEEKDLLVEATGLDQLNNSQACPICDSADCGWRYKNFAEAFDFEDVEGPDPEELYYWIEDDRIIYEPPDDERFEGSFDREEI